jgi:hypothetical protein
MKKLLKIVIIIIGLLVSVVVLGVLALAVMAKMYTSGGPMSSGEKIVGPYIIDFRFDYKYHNFDEGKVQHFYFMLDYPSFESAPYSESSATIIEHPEHMRFTLSYDANDICNTAEECKKIQNSHYKETYDFYIKNPDNKKNNINNPVHNSLGDLSKFYIEQIGFTEEYYYKGNISNPDFVIKCKNSSNEKIDRNLKTCFNFRNMGNNLFLSHWFSHDQLNNNYQDFFNKTDAFLNQYITTNTKE